MKPMQQLAESLADFSSMLEWGSPSYKTWRKACDDSLLKSARRRERAEEDSWGWRVGVPILITMLVLVVVLLWVGILTGKVNI